MDSSFCIPSVSHAHLINTWSQRHRFSSNHSKSIFLKKFCLIKVTDTLCNHHSKYIENWCSQFWENWGNSKLFRRSTLEWSLRYQIPEERSFKWKRQALVEQLVQKVWRKVKKKNSVKLNFQQTDFDKYQRLSDAVSSIKASIKYIYIYLTPKQVFP